MTDIFSGFTPAATAPGFDDAADIREILARLPYAVANAQAIGAVADDAHDAGPAIQAAHDALPATGGEILIPPGKYYVATQLSITKPNVVIRGVGGHQRLTSGTAATRLRWATNADMIALGPLAQGFVLRDLGVATISTGAVVATAATDPAYGRIEGCRLIGTSLMGYGVRVKGGACWRIVNCHVEAFDVGVAFENNNGASVVRDSTLTANRTGLRIGATGGSGGVQVTGCDLELNTVYDVDVDNGAAIHLRGNFFESASGSVCVHVGGATSTARLTIADNYFGGNSASPGAGPAIQLVRVAGCAIERNYFADYPAGFTITNTATAVSGIRLRGNVSNLGDDAMISSYAGVDLVERADGLLAPAVSVYRSVNLTLATGAGGATQVTWDSEQGADPYAMHSTSSNTDRLVAPLAGRYRVWGTVRYAANATGMRYANLFKNGSLLLPVVRIAAGSAADDVVASFSHTLILAVGDYLTLQARQDSGGNLDLVAGATASVFGMEKVA